MFESLAGQLRGSVPDRLSSVLDTDLRDTRRAMEVSLPALIGGLRDKTLEPDGPADLIAILEGPAGNPIDDVEGYMLDNDPRVGAGVLDQVFGSRGENALTSLGKASGLGTKLLAQVMSMLAPVAVSWLSDKQQHEGYSEKELADYLDGEAGTLEDAGYGKVLALVSGESAPAPKLAAVATPEPAAPLVTPASPSVVTVADGVDDADFEDDFRIPATPDQIDASAIPGGAGVATAAAGAPTVVIGDTPAGVPGSAAPMAAPATGLPDASTDRDFDYGGGDRWGWAWWLLALIALLCLLALFWVQCRGNDDETVDTVDAATSTEEPASVAVDAPADPQAVLTATMGSFPGVTGVLNGDTAILSGSVSDAAIRQSAEATALTVDGVNSVQNDLTVGGGNRIPDVINGNDQLTILYQVINEANLQDQLSGQQMFTLFAPSDAAFNALGADELAALRADPAKLQTLLYYHLASGSFPESELDGGGDLSTIQGEGLHFEKVDGEQEINFAASYVQTDIATENGLIHIIDAVLLPEALGGTPAATASTPTELGAELSLSPITFESSQATLTDAGRTELDKVVAYLTENPQPVEVAGHTDTTGPDDLNQRLSQERADSVRQYLIDNAIPADSITATGYGESEPLVVPDDNDEAAKAKNRRIEFILGG